MSMCNALHAVSMVDPLSYCSSSASGLTWYDFVAEYGHDRWPKTQTADAAHTRTPRRYGVYDNLVDLARCDEYA